MDNDFDRTPIYQLEKPLSSDVNQGFSQSDRSLRDVMFAILSGQSGFWSSNLQVVQSGPPALSVVLKAGLGVQDAPTDLPTNLGGALGVNDLSRYKPIVLVNDLTVAVPAPPGANSRIDLIEVRYNRQLDNSQSRNFLNPGTGAFAPALVAKTLDFTVDGTLAYYAAAAVPTTALAYKSGVAGVSPVAPATDTGYMPLAYITVATGVTTIVTANISDQRPMVFFGRYLGKQRITATGTYTPANGAVEARATVVAGGGGSGGAACAGGHATAVGAAASGNTCYKEVRSSAGLLTGGAATIGAAGAAGASGNNNGGDGGDSSLVINGGTILAKGGAGSPGEPDPGGLVAGVAGVAPKTGSSGFDDITGECGGGSMTPNGTAFLPGNGGSSPFGIGGLGTAGAPPTANPGTGHGSGGGGFITVGANSAGAAGTLGIIEIEEWM